MLPITLIALLVSVAFASPTPQPMGISMTLRHRVPSRSAEDLGVWAKNHREGLIAKYGGSSTSRRSTGTNLFVLLHLSPIDDITAPPESPIMTQIPGKFFTYMTSHFCDALLVFMAHLLLAHLPSPSMLLWTLDLRGDLFLGFYPSSHFFFFWQ